MTISINHALLANLECEYMCIADGFFSLHLRSAIGQGVMWRRLCGSQLHTKQEAPRANIRTKQQIKDDEQL